MISLWYPPQKRRIPKRKGIKETKMNVPKISKRLEAAASLGRRGVRIADIGTDHAYLPIYLYTTGAAAGGVAADINEGPVQRARMNIRGWGAQGAIDVLRTDGLAGIERYAPDDIYVLGMGGELIVNIIDAAPWVRRDGVRLILQPMTHPEILRGYLYSNGFSVVEELLVKDEKIYQIICAEYGGSGASRDADAAELLFGRRNLERGGELLRELLLRTKDIYAQRMLGKAKAENADVDEERAMIENIDNILEEKWGK